MNNQLVNVNEKMVFEIYEENMANFEKRMAKLAKKAIKIGNGNVGYVILSEQMVKVNRLDSAIPQIYKKFTVQITGSEAPVIEGWSFIAILNHELLANVINIVPTFTGTIPERFRHTGTICEHCNVNRLRNDTYILFNESTGEYKQVGRSCLKDFLGHTSPTEIARYAEYLIEFNEDMEDMIKFGGSNIPEYIDVQAGVETSIAIIETVGYTTKAKAEEEHKQSTAQMVYAQIFSCEAMKPFAGLTITAEHKQKATDMIEFIKTCEVVTDYEINLQTIANAKYMPVKFGGYTTSFVPFFAKRKELANKVSDIRVSKHVGNAGDKVELTVKVEKVLVFDGYYGITRMHMMKDIDGNIFVWKTGSGNLEEGSTLTIKATIKEHVEYKGINQTEILRVKEVKQK